MVLSLVVIAVFAPRSRRTIRRARSPALLATPARPRAFPLGTDQLGRDVLSRIIYGARISLTVGVAAMAVTMTIGVTIGLLSGFFGGAIDFVLMRFTDVMLTLPALLLAMAFVAVLRPSLLSILLVIGLVSWTGVARVVRAEALSMTQRDFVLAARALGAPSARLIVRHVLPNVMPIIVVMAVLGTSGTLLLDAGSEFLGLGVPPPTPSWGRMIEEATTYFRIAPVARDFPGPRDLLRGARLQPARLWLSAPPRPHRRCVAALMKSIREPRECCRWSCDGRGSPRAHVVARLRLGVLNRRSDWSFPGCRSGAPPLHFPPGAMVLQLADARRCSDARSGGWLRHRFVDLRADDLRYAGALQRRWRRSRARPRDALGILARRDRSSRSICAATCAFTNGRASPAPISNMRSSACSIPRRVQRYGVLPRDRRRR